jgi:hypothetical protein
MASNLEVIRVSGESSNGKQRDGGHGGEAISQGIEMKGILAS